MLLGVPENIPELKIPDTEDSLHLSYSVAIANSTAKESVINQDELLQSKKRTRGIKVNYLEMATGSSLKISTPHKNVQKNEGTPRKSSRIAISSKSVITEIKTPLHEKLLKTSAEIDEESELKELIVTSEVMNVVMESTKESKILKVTVPRKNSRKKVAVAIEKLTEQEAIESDKIVTQKKVDKSLDETGEIAVVVDEQSFIIEEPKQVADLKPVRKGRGGLAAKNKLNIAEQKPVTTDKLNTETPRRGRKKQVKDDEAKPVVSKKADFVEAKFEKTVEKPQMEENIAEQKSVTATKLSTETPRRGRKKTVKDVEIKPVVEAKSVEKMVAEQKSVTTDKLNTETPRRGRKKQVKDDEAKPVVSEKTDFVEAKFEKKETTVEKPQMEENKAEQKSVTAAKLSTETPKRGRKKTVKDVEIKPVVEAKLVKDVVEEMVAEQKSVTASKLSTETPRRGRKKKTDLVEVDKKDFPIQTEEISATVIRSTKKRKAKPETIITTDIIPKRQLRGAATKNVIETPQEKDDQKAKAIDVIVIETVEPNSRKRKIKPTTLEADVTTAVKKSRVKSKRAVVDSSANETLEVQHLQEKTQTTEPKSSKDAKKAVVTTEVKRSTRREN